jgi:sugar phosphate isomerase/epimerase
MRLGAYIPAPTDGGAPEAFPDPASWALAQAKYGYSAAGLPLQAPVDNVLVAAYVAAAEAFNIQIAEVSAWSNPLSPDAAVSKAAIQRCEQQLALAEEAGARCCINIAGSLAPTGNGAHAPDLTEATFALIVDTVREIIDAVQPSRTYYTLETMPWLYPDSIDSYERLLGAVERPAFAVHFDPVNLVSSPQRYFQNGLMIREFVRRLGEHIRSCHAKDVRLTQELTVHLDEVRPGTGALDYRAFVTAVEAADTQIPMLVEHLKTKEECVLATDHIRAVCDEVSVQVIAPAYGQRSRLHREQKS